MTAPPYPVFERSKRRTWGHWTYTMREDFIVVVDVEMPGDTHYVAYGGIVMERIGSQTKITILSGTQWNGATCAPDFRAVIPGTAVHDEQYRLTKELSKAMGISRRRFRKFSDDCFNDINRQFGFGFALRLIYYRAVRRLGWIMG